MSALLLSKFFGGLALSDPFRLANSVFKIDFAEFIFFKELDGLLSLLMDVLYHLGDRVQRVILQVVHTLFNGTVNATVLEGIVGEELGLEDRVDVSQNTILEVGRGHERVLREVKQERHDLANVLQIQLVVE